LFYDGGKGRRGVKEMTEEEKQERLTSIAKLIKRLGDEDWTKWLEEEKQSIDSIKTTQNEVATVSREMWYDQLLKKILYESYDKPKITDDGNTGEE
jgi:hypothetical protein